MNTSTQDHAVLGADRTAPVGVARAAPQSMRAMAHDTYGSFDALRLRHIAKPVAKRDQVLVRVHAAGLHVGDCFGVRGAPFLMRLGTGLFRPKYGVPGLRSGRAR